MVPALVAAVRRLWLVAMLAVAAGPAVAADLVAAPEDDPALLAPPPVPEGWATVPGTHLVVHGHPEESPLLVALARHGAATLPELAATLQVPIGPRVHVYVAGSSEEFRDLQPGRTPEWADGTAWPERGVVFLRSPRARAAGTRDLEKVLDHELIHILLGRAFAPHEPPRWLQEGMARVYAGEHTPQTTTELAEGLLGGLYTLEELHASWPRNGHGARLAYAQSSDFVAWLRAEHGDAALATMVRHLARGDDIDVAVRAATGRSLAEVDRAWRDRLTEGPPLWLTAVFTEQGAWALIGGLAVVALVAQRRRLRRRMADLAERERREEALLARLAGDSDPMVH